MSYATYEKAMESGKIQLRDMEVVVELYKRKVLTGEQIRQLKFSDLNPSSGYRKAMQRLKVLVDLKLVRMFFVERNYYAVTPSGLYMVANALDTSAEELRATLKDNQTVQNLEHYVQTNDVGIALRSAGKVQDYVVGVRVPMDGWWFIPDAVGSMVHKKSMDFYVELDRGTESPKSFANKVPRYERYYMSKKYLVDYDKFPYVLIVTTTENRVKKLLAVTQKESVSDITFMFTTMKLLEDDPQGKIWAVPKHENRFSILQAGK